MKVIGTSNFDDKKVSDILVQAGLSNEEAVKVCAAKNKNEGGAYDIYIFAVVPDNYKLYERGW